MKLPTLTLVIALIQQTAVQHTLAQDDDKNFHRIVISVSGGAFLPQRAGRNLEVSFPYVSRLAVTGVTTTRQFSGSLGGDFPRAAFMADVVNIESIRRRHTINGGFCLFQDGANNVGALLKAGYSRVLPLHRSHFRLQFGVDLDGVLGGYLEMGQIDNKGQTIQFLGYTATPQWTETHSGRYSTYTKTYDADHLSFIYQRNALLTEPKVVMATSIKKLYLGVEAGWMLQLLQGCTLKAEQEDGGSNNRNTIAKMHEPRNGSMSGLYVAIRVGLIKRS